MSGISVRTRIDRVVRGFKATTGVRLRTGMDICIFAAAFMPIDQSTEVAIQRVTPNSNYCGGQEYMDNYLHSATRTDDILGDKEL